MHGNTISKSYKNFSNFPPREASHIDLISEETSYVRGFFLGGGAAFAVLSFSVKHHGKILYFFRKTKQLDTNISLYIRNTIPVLYIYIITPSLH
jgi:hypothetical protein